MRIRHLIIPSLIAIVSLSCTRETVDTGGDKAGTGIGFTTRLDTRGTVIETASALAGAGGFDVWAFTHQNAWDVELTPGKTAMMNSQPVTSTDGSTWSYGEPQIWPSTGYVSFFAYGPENSATEDTPLSDGTPQVSFTVDSDVTDQVDLLIATPVKNQSGSAYIDDSSVIIDFKHALSRISFSGLLTSSSDQREITVKQIKLNNLYGGGTTPLTDPVSWTLSGTANQSYTVSVADGTLSGTPFTDDGVSLTANGDYLFMMPQTVVRTIDTPTMDVTLTIDGEDVKYNSLVFSPSVWEAGHSYNYQLVVGPDDLRIIVIDTALTLEPFDERVVENVIFLTNDKDVDATNLVFVMNAINSMNTDPVYASFPRYGLYAVGAVTHDITIDIGSLLSAGGTLTGGGNFTDGQILMLDLRKHVTTWGNDPVTGTTAKVEITNYSTWWNKMPSKQLPNDAGDVDAATGATTQTPSDVITSRGTFILQRKQL